MEWMRDSFELLADRRLDELLLPGTHDSAAHALAAGQPLGTSASDRFLAWLGRAFPSAVAPWTLTQHATVYEQLCGGVRFLDLRVAWSPPQNPGGRGAPRSGAGEGEGALWCAHTFACQPLKAVLQAVCDFLDATSHEVVVLALRPDWPHRRAFADQPHLGARLAADVAAALRGRLYPPPHPQPPADSGRVSGSSRRPDVSAAVAGGLQLPTLGAMVGSARRVLVFFDAPRPAPARTPAPMRESSSGRALPPHARQPLAPPPPPPPVMAAAVSPLQPEGPAAPPAAAGAYSAGPEAEPSACCCCCGGPSSLRGLRLPACCCLQNAAGAGASTAGTPTAAQGSCSPCDGGHGGDGSSSGCSSGSSSGSAECYCCGSSSPADLLWLGSLCRPLWADSDSPRGTVTGLLRLLADARRRPLGPGLCWHAAAAATPTPLSVVRDVLRYGTAAAGLRRLAAELEATELPRLLAAAAAARPAPASGLGALPVPKSALTSASGLSAAELESGAERATGTLQAVASGRRGDGDGNSDGHGDGDGDGTGNGTPGNSSAAAGSSAAGRSAGGSGARELLGLGCDAGCGGGEEAPGGSWSGPGGLLRWGRVCAVCLDHPSPQALEAVWSLNLQQQQQQQQRAAGVTGAGGSDVPACRAQGSVLLL